MITVCYLLQVTVTPSPRPPVSVIPPRYKESSNAYVNALSAISKTLQQLLNVERERLKIESDRLKIEQSRLKCENLHCNL